MTMPRPHLVIPAQAGNQDAQALPFLTPSRPSPSLGPGLRRDDRKEGRFRDERVAG